MRTLCILVALAGCIEPSLVPCDETVCPSGTACGPTGGCVPEDQLTACLGLEEREDCVVAAGEGVCMMGVCQPEICGNGTQTPDEACDDGNNINGDGCAADCRSNETCGNGITDGATGEACDDGNTVNDDDCRADCSLPRCGDGTLDAFEQCEPGDPATDDTTCRAFGYYEGTVVCGTQCRYTPEGCSGRCGDLEVQSAYGEECDGSPPAFTCVDQGFDHGAIGCTQRCVGDLLGTCERFGWSVLDAATGTLTAADGDTAVVAAANRVTIVRSGDREVFSLADTISVDVQGDTVLVARTNTIFLYDATNSPQELPAIPSLASVVAARLANDGVPWALFRTATNCSINRLVGDVWEGVTTLPFTCRSFFLLPSGESVIGIDGGLRWARPAGPVFFSRSGTLVAVEPAGDAIHAYFVEATPAQVVRETIKITGKSIETKVVLELPHAAAATTVKDGVAYTVTMLNELVRGATGRPEGVVLPTIRPRFPTVARDGRLLLLADDGLFAARSMVRGTRLWDDKLDSPGNVRVAVGSDGAVVLCGDAVAVIRGRTPSAVAISEARCEAVVVQGAGPTFVVRDKDGEDSIVRIDTPTNVTTEYIGSGVEQLATDGTATAARAGDSVLLRTANGTWETLPPLPCTPNGLAVAGGVLASCFGPTGGVFELAGSTWDRVVTRQDVVALASSPDKVIFVALLDGALRRLPGQPSFESMAGPESPVTRLVAVGMDELYADVLGDNFIHRWDGSRWSPIAFPPGDAFAVTADEIMSVAPDASGSSIFARLFVLLRGLD